MKKFKPNEGVFNLIKKTPEESLGLTTRDADEQNDGAGYFECNSHVQWSRNRKTDLHLQSVKVEE